MSEYDCCIDAYDTWTSYKFIVTNRVTMYILLTLSLTMCCMGLAMICVGAAAYEVDVSTYLIIGGIFVLIIYLLALLIFSLQIKGTRNERIFCCRNFEMGYLYAPFLILILLVYFGMLYGILIWGTIIASGNN